MMVSSQSVSSFVLQVGGPTTVAAPADATTYFFGQQMINALDTAGNRKRIYIPRNAILKAVYCVFQQTAAGSAETSSIYFRLNDTTDTLISSAVVNNVTGVTTFSNNSLAVPVVAGDYFELKWITPTWTGANPTNFTFNATVFFE